MSSLAPWYFYVSEVFGLGRLPMAPGTWGSLGALVLFVLMQIIFPEPVLGAIILTVVGLSFPICNWASKYMGQWDPKNIVLDEVAGQWIALWPLFWIEYWPNPWWGFLAGFLLFRFFDITKLFPINLFDNMKNGYGITLDDVMAGIYTNGCLIVIGLWWV